MADRAEGTDTTPPPAVPRPAEPVPVAAEVSDAGPEGTVLRPSGKGPAKAGRKRLPRRKPTPRGNGRAEEVWRLRPQGRAPEEVRTRWGTVQSEFVDDPAESVRAADVLASEVAEAAIAAIEARHTELRAAWQEGSDADTEALRLVLRDYRAFVRRLIGDT